MTSSQSPTTHPLKHRLFLVEDHPVTREGFARLLNFEPDLVVCGQAGTAAEAMLAVPLLSPDLVIVDIALGGRSGLDLLKDLSARHPELPMLVLSTYEESLYALRTLRAGARGYIMKSASTEQIFQAVRRVLDGKTYLSDTMNEQLRSRMVKGISAAPTSDTERLSDRELEVFTLLGQGRSTAEIAAALNLSPNTIGTHRAHIQEKLGFQSLNELVCRAVQWVQGGL